MCVAPLSGETQSGNMAIDLNKITDFFKPNRQVWQDAGTDIPGSSNVDTDTDVDTDADVDSDTDYEAIPKSAEEISDFEQMIEIAKQAEDECKSAKKAICSLQKDEVWDAGEMNRLRKFIDELDDKFFVKVEGEEKLNYTSDRLKRLEKQLNMELLISEFLKSVKADITTYPDWKTDKYPNLNDHIVFTYEDGTRKAINLEMALNPPALVSDYSGGEDEHTESETESIGDRASEYLPFSYDFSEVSRHTAGNIKKLRDILFKQDKEIDELDTIEDETEEEREKRREEFEAASEEYERRMREDEEDTDDY
jgi:hypothetical protein